MPMTLIEGHFEVVGAAPDGDSVKFYPRDKNDWKVLGQGHNVRSNQRGGAQLRLDGIDALETHYSPGGGLGVLHQPLKLARGASAELLDWIGFHDVSRDANEKVTDAEPKKISGYVLTRFADVYGRCVAFAFKGSHPKKTGDDVWLDEKLLRTSLNYHLLQTGFAYPTYYSKLFYEVRQRLTEAVKAARQSGKGIWSRDRTSKGFTVGRSLDEVQSRAFVLPKLFRRMVDYFALNDGDTSLDGFIEYLSQRDDRVYVISRGQVTGFDSVVHVEEQRVELSSPSEDLIFQEK